MTKADLVADVAKTNGLTRIDAEVVVQTVLDSIVEALNSGEKVELRGFGSFPSPPAKPAPGTQSKNRRGSPGSCEESRLFQTGQGAERADQFLNSQPGMSKTVPAARSPWMTVP